MGAQDKDGPESGGAEVVLTRFKELGKKVAIEVASEQVYQAWGSAPVGHPLSKAHAKARQLCTGMRSLDSR